MTSIGAVKIALERGNKEDALYLLRKILKTKPSAEAFYLAGKLAPNKVMAKKFLKQSLQLQPDYEPSVIFLQIIERQEQRQTDQLRSEMLEGFDTGLLEEPHNAQQGVLKRILKVAR